MAAGGLSATGHVRAGNARESCDVVPFRSPCDSLGCRQSRPSAADLARVMVRAHLVEIGTLDATKGEVGKGIRTSWQCALVDEAGGNVQSCRQFFDRQQRRVVLFGRANCHLGAVIDLNRLVQDRAKERGRAEDWLSARRPIFAGMGRSVLVAQSSDVGNQQ